MSKTIIRSFEMEDLPEVREIFFESSTRKDFKDVVERDAFFWKYVGFYLENFPDYAFIASERKVMGYVLGMPHSQDQALFVIQPHMVAFQKYFNDYPAHLHINCHHDARGLGLGGLLVAAFEQKIEKENPAGLHILTGVDSRNKSFYQKLGFLFEKIESFQGHPILFMGKKMKETVV